MMFAVNDPALIGAIYSELRRVIDWRIDLHERFGSGHDTTTYKIDSKKADTFSLLTYGNNPKPTNHKIVEFNTMFIVREWLKNVPTDAEYIAIETFKNGFYLHTIADPFDVLN